MTGKYSDSSNNSSSVACVIIIIIICITIIKMNAAQYFFIVVLCPDTRCNNKETLNMSQNIQIVWVTFTRQPGTNLWDSVCTHIIDCCHQAGVL